MSTVELQRKAEGWRAAARDAAAAGQWLRAADNADCSAICWERVARQRAGMVGTADAAKNVRWLRSMAASYRGRAL
jgi:hypothetical protein